MAGPALSRQRAALLRLLSPQPRPAEIGHRRRAAAREAVGLSRELRDLRPLHRLSALPLHLHARPDADRLEHLRPLRDLCRGARVPAASQTPPDPLRPPPMQRLTLAGGVPEDLRGSIVALGNFDG